MTTVNEKLDISALPPASRRELLSYYHYLLERRPAKKSSRQKNKSFSELCGKLSWEGDAVATQRKLRDEW
jgi:hypothetical protein